MAVVEFSSFSLINTGFFKDFRVCKFTSVIYSDCFEYLTETLTVKPFKAIENPGGRSGGFIFGSQNDFIPRSRIKSSAVNVLLVIEPQSNSTLLLECSDRMKSLRE